MMIIILFGIAGSGKNYVGKTIANHKNYFFYDGDALLSTEMIEFIRKKKPFTPRMRDQLTQHMIAKIIELQKQHTHIVFAQALYKEKNREQLLKAFPQAQFFLITSSQENIISRLKRRNDWIDEKYAALLSKHFDQPAFPHRVIENNAGPQKIITQIEKFFK